MFSWLTRIFPASSRTTNARMDRLERQNAELSKKLEMLLAGIHAAAMQTMPGTLNADIEMIMWRQAGTEAADFAALHMSKGKIFGNVAAIREFALGEAQDGLYLEFGVFSGNSINQMAETKKDRIFYGFDSFEGLPETWRAGFEAGIFSKDELPEVRENVELIKGWFDETLPAFLERHPETCAFVHVDCDLYSSAETVLNYLSDRIVVGTVLLFDEFFNYPGWKDNEFKAFQNFVQRSGHECEYLGFVKNYEQVAVRIVR